MSQLGAVTGRHAFDIDSLTSHLERHLPEFRGPVEVQQFQGDAGLLPLGVEVRTIRDGAAPPAGIGYPVEAGFQDVVGEPLDLGPVQAGVGGPAEHAGHHPDTDLQARRHLAVAAGHGPLLAEDLPKLAHG